MNATPVTNSLEVLEAATLPDGERYFVTACADFDVYRKLPAAAELAGVKYGLTGWNSDSGRAYYKDGKQFARGC